VNLIGQRACKVALVNGRCTKRVLIYRLGSLGDTVVALPCFHLMARVFPDAERWLLTNIPVSPKAPSPATVLGGSGLIHGLVDYPVRLRGLSTLRALSRRIRDLRPELLVYLVERTRVQMLARDLLFFRASGIAHIVGAPCRRDLRRHRYDAASQTYEPEAARLARTLSAVGDARCDDPASWDLQLGSGERTRAAEVLHRWPGRDQFLVCCVGTKVDVKDWGVANWQAMLAQLSKDHPSMGLVLVGASQEASVSTEAARKWSGPKLNLCGSTTPRETAALLERARLFIGHDSGPMHLAAAVGTRCVAVFSARQRPRIWFPFGDGHRVIYHRTACEGCGLEQCVTFGKKCMTSINVGEVHAAVSATLTDSLLALEPSASAATPR
jgi:lipopolysaccharide heptosyltransferase III